jgi:hypothetical protein
MKPNIKSKYFKLSLVVFFCYLASLLYARFYVINAIKTNSDTSLVIYLFILGLVFMYAGTILWYASSHPHAKRSRQLLLAFIAPFALIPILAIMYVVVVLLPIYSLATRLN